MPQPHDIRQPAQEISRHLAIGKLKTIPSDSPTAPIRLDEHRLDELNQQLDNSDGWPSLATVTPLVSHAAWYIMKHFPRATYTRDDDLAHIPNLSAIQMISRQWTGAIAQPSRNARNPARVYRKSKLQTVPIPEAENRRLWAVRTEAAQQFDTHYQQTGQLPERPSPYLANGDDPDLLAVIEGWHDFVDRYPRLVGTLYVDYLTKTDHSGARWLSAGEGPAIPPALREDPVKMAKEQYASKEAKAIVWRANIRPELKELATQRVVVDLTDPPAQRIRLSRKRITDKFPGGNFHGIEGLDEDDHTLAVQTGKLVDWLKGMSFASFADVANSTANLTVRMGNAIKELLENRAKFRSKPSRSSREAEGKLRPRVQKCLDQLTQLAEAQAQEAPSQPMQKAWAQTVARVDRVRQDVTERTMPVQQSPYETEAYDRLEAMNHQELTRLAIRSHTGYGILNTGYGILNPGRRERLLLLPGRWIVQWTEDQNGASEPNVRHFDHIHMAHDSWVDFITAMSQQEQPEAPADLRHLVEPAPPDDNDDVVRLPDMKPAQIGKFAGRFYKAATIELHQRLHTVPERMRQPAIATLHHLSQDDTRTERYTAGRYREIVGHAVKAYLACRFPGRWETAVDELNKAVNVPRRAGQYDEEAAVRNLQEWLAAAELEYITEVAGQPAEDNILAIWRDAINQAPIAPPPSVRTAREEKPARRKTARPQDLTYPMAL